MSDKHIDAAAQSILKADDPNGGSLLEGLYPEGMEHYRTLARVAVGAWLTSINMTAANMYDIFEGLSEHHPLEAMTLEWKEAIREIELLFGGLNP